MSVFPDICANNFATESYGLEKLHSTVLSFGSVNPNFSHFDNFFVPQRGEATIAYGGDQG